jgi:hypothetical protein
MVYSLIYQFNIYLVALQQQYFEPTRYISNSRSLDGSSEKSWQKHQTLSPEQNQHRVILHNYQAVFNITKPTDWYNIKASEINRHSNLKELLSNYNSSISDALATLFPEFGLKPWLFEYQQPRGLWQDTQNQRRYIKWLEEKLGIKVR